MVSPKMTKPTFAEKFPELQEYLIYSFEEVQKAENNGTGIKYKWISTFAVEEYCLSRSRVLEAIEKVFNGVGREGVIIEYPKGTNSWRFEELKEQLLNELGLVQYE